MHVEIFEGEVAGLGGKVPDDVDEIAFVVSFPPLLLVQSFEAIHNAIIRLFNQLFLNERSLQLQSNFDDFNGRGKGLRYNCCSTANQKFGKEL